MARRYIRRDNRRSSRYDYGRERARQHIDDARRLSTALGGTDKDVKAYFLGLSASRLKPIFDAYEARFGSAKRQYAENAIPKWRAGTTQMSGTVAERLFDLLPPMMPLADKYRLTEKLWDHFGPSSKKVMRVGVDASASDVAKAFLAHIESVMGQFKLPDELERRFAWLAAGDVAVKQQLLNQLMAAERALVAEGIRLQLPVMQQHLATDVERSTQRIAQIVKIRKHQLEIILDRDAHAISIEDAPRYGASTLRSAKGDSGAGCFWIAIAILVLIVWLSSQR